MSGAGRTRARQGEWRAGGDEGDGGDEEGVHTERVVPEN